MAALYRRNVLRMWIAAVVSLVLVVAGLSWPGTAMAAPARGSDGKVQPRGDGGWTPAKPPRSSTVAYKQQPGRAPLAVMKPDPHAKRVKELTSRRTANASYFQMSDGGVQEEVSGLPVHYRNAKGAWQPIDSSVRKVAHGGFTVGAQGNAFQTYFSPNASSLLRIEQGPAWVQLGADGATTAAPKTSGSTVSYPGAYRGADLTYQVGPQSVRDAIVLSKAPAVGQSYSFTMLLSGGLVPQQLPDGAIVVHGTEADTPVFTIPAPYMSDAKNDANSPYRKVFSTKVSQGMTFDAATRTLHVTVTPDAGWLHDGKRVYPVTIDPTILVSPTPSTAANTMILADGATTNYSTSWRLSVGTTTTGAARTLIRFPLSTVPAGTTIASADLALYYDQTFTTDANNVPMQALQANAAWNPATATWSNASGIGGPVAGTATMTARAAGAWVHFPVTSAVQNWVNGASNNGFVLKATNESTLGQGGPRFEGSIYAYGGEVVNYPKLVITYGAPGVAVNAPTVIHATGAELSWPAYTNSTGDSANDLAEYQVHRSVYQSFTPGQNTLVSPVAPAVKSFVDSTAVPTPANSTDPYGNAYYYMVVVKTKGGKLIPGPTTLVRLPKAGRTTLLIPVTNATTLASAQPTTVLNTLSNAGTAEPWLEVGDNSSTYGVARSVFDVGALSQVPAGSKILDAHLKLWQETTTTTTTSTGAVYELHGLTRSFTGTQATWNSAATGTAWTAAGGDFSATVGGTVSGLTNDPNRQNLDATSIVQGWVTTPSANHGLLVKLKAETSTSPQERTIFAGPKTAEARLAPQLVVTYLDTSTGATYYAPSTPTDMVVGTTYTTPVTINNTSTSTWPAASEVLSYHWNLPDGSEVSAPANQLQTKLPADLPPGGTVTLNAQVTPPTPIGGNQSEGYSLGWDMLNTTTSTFLSAAASGTGSLKQQVSVDPSGNNQLGLENFYQYTTTPTGAGTNLFTNLASGNTVWNYDLFANPSRGFSTLLRLSYNSLSTFDTNTGFGWAMQASAPIRVGQALQVNPPGNPSEVVMVDGTGNAHKWTLNTTTNVWASPPGVHLHLQKLVACGPQMQEARAWSMTRPDRTVYFFDCEGFPTAEVDNNGNEADFTYSTRQSENKPEEFLTYITDPVARQTLTLTYYNKGDSYSYVDSSGNLVSATNLTDPDIIDHVKSITDIGGRTVNLYYTVQGLLGRLVDGAGDPAAKTFKFSYDMTQGMKNVKLIAVQDPRGHTTAISYYPPSSPFKWLTQSVTDRLGHTTSLSYLQPGTVTGSAQQTTVVDANSQSWVYQIDSAGRMIQTVNPRNETTKLAWDGDNNVKTLTEDNNATTTFTYDQKTGYPLTVTDAANKATASYVYAFDPSGYIADLTDTVSAAGRHSHYTYDGFGNLKTAQAPNGVSTGSGFITSYDYDSFGNLTSVTDANGHVSGYGYFQHLPAPVLVYDPTGRPTTLVDAMGNVTDATYGPRGEMTQITDPLQHTATRSYDIFLRPLASKVPKDQASNSYITTPAPGYDTNDNVTTTTAPNGAATTAAYDADDQKTSTTLPADTSVSPARIITYTYDALGNLQSETQPNGNLSGATPGSYTKTFRYDAISEPKTVTDALGKTTTYDYDTVGNRIKVTDPLNHVTQMTYDLDHRATVSTDALGHTASVQYDADGLVLNSTDENGETIFYSLDPNGQLTQVEAPHSTAGPSVVYDTTQYGYDQVGNNTSVVSPRGVEVANQVANSFTTSAEFDAANRLSKVFGAYDASLPAGDVYGKDNRPETDYTYDAASRITQVSQVVRQPGVTPTSTTNTYNYFDNGWIKRSTDPFHITTDYDYNELGEQTSRKLTASDGTASRTMAWSYYPDGKLLAFADGGVPNGWQDQVVTASSFNTQFAVRDWTPGPDNAGFDGSTYFVSQGGTAFTWNLSVPQDGNYTVYVWYSHAGVGPVSLSVNDSAPISVDERQNVGTWVAVSNPATANGEWSLKAGTGSKVALSPGAPGQIADAVRIVRDNSGDTQPSPTNTTYTYDPNGNRTEVKDLSPNAQFDDYAATFDQLNRPTQLLEKTGGVAQHTLTYGYDDDSNVTSQTNDFAVNTYSYDARNLLSKVVNQQSSADPGITTTYTYTPTGQRETQHKGNGNTVTNTYNLDGTLSTSVEKTSGGTIVDSHLLDYDRNNNVTLDDISLQNADNGGTLDRTATRTYSPNDQVTSVKYPDGKNDQTYTYDSAGNVVRQTTNTPDGLADVNFLYDRGRVYTTLQGGFTGTYQYDTLGRLHAVLNGTWTGRTTGVGQEYKYDGYDNITSQSSTGDNGVRTTAYTYDSLNRPLTATISPGGDLSEKATFNYVGTTGAVNDEQIISTAGGTDSKTYDYAPDGERLALLDSFYVAPPPSNQTSYYTYNPHTDVEALTNEQGATIDTYGYTAYGADDANFRSGPDKDTDKLPVFPYNSYRFNSARIATSTGNLDMGFRTYDPNINQFISRDMYNGAGADAGLAGGRYGFAGGNPVSNVELDGHDWKSTLGSVVAGIAIFAGCAALGIATEGAGLILCGVLAGAGAGAAGQGINCAEGQAGACSGEAFAESITLGAVIGGITAGVGGEIAGGLPESLPGWASGAIVGGGSGAVAGGLEYGLTCVQCSWTGFAEATALGAGSGLALGGAFGAFGGRSGATAEAGATEPVTDAQLLADAKALHEAYADGLTGAARQKAMDKVTVATAEFGGKKYYAVSSNRTSEAMRELAEELGYERVFGKRFLRVSPKQTHAEHILLNARDSGEINGGPGRIAPSRQPCVAGTASFQGCAVRVSTYPGVNIVGWP